MISYRQADIVTQLNRLEFLEKAAFFTLLFKVSKRTRSYIPDEDIPIDITYVGCRLRDAELNDLLGHNFLRWQVHIEDVFKKWMDENGFVNNVYHGKVRPFTDAMGRLPGHRNTSQDLEDNLQITYDIPKMTNLDIL
jgi:hypothetical protein